MPKTKAGLWGNSATLRLRRRRCSLEPKIRSRLRTSFQEQFHDALHDGSLHEETGGSQKSRMKRNEGVFH